MKERPILFCSEMVRAILEGRKTQTRRVIKPQPIEIGTWKNTDEPVFSTNKWAQVEAATFIQECPYGTIGDRLWVREGFALNGSLFYQSDGLPDREVLDLYPKWKWRPSIFMPRIFSRITLEIVKVRVERVREITEIDAMDEGLWDGNTSTGPEDYFMKEFQKLWDLINAKRGFGWETNPWVWVIEFNIIINSEHKI